MPSSILLLNFGEAVRERGVSFSTKFGENGSYSATLCFPERLKEKKKVVKLVPAPRFTSPDVELC
jgi:hypothetical protein